MTVNLNQDQKSAIRQAHPDLLLQFRSNGAVLAKPRVDLNEPWGVLLTPAQVKSIYGKKENSNG